MAETKNVSEMANIISDLIFSELRWEINHEDTDLNWNCVNSNHGKSTHPTDIVFSYIDPYRGIPVYIQTDLKSYSEPSISKPRVSQAILSLAMQVECAKSSPEWSKIYRKGESEYDIYGMLFIFNNDNQFDSDLMGKLSYLVDKDIVIPKSSLITVLTPQKIAFLINFVKDIESRRHIDTERKKTRVDELIPKHSECGFYYPNTVSRDAISSENKAASIEMITSGMLFFEYKHPENEKRILNIYWDEEISSEKQFIYLFEYIFNYQLFNFFDLIFVVNPFGMGASGHFKIAKKIYKAQIATSKHQQDKVEKLKILTMPIVQTTLFDFEMCNGTGAHSVLRHLVTES